MLLETLAYFKIILFSMLLDYSRIPYMAKGVLNGSLYL